MLASIQSQLRAAANPEKAAFFPRFFKTGPGEYAEGDTFIGVTVPNIRKAVKAHRDLPLNDVITLLKDRIHEFRLAGVLILVEKYQRGDQKIKMTLKLRR